MFSWPAVGPHVSPAHFFFCFVGARLSKLHPHLVFDFCLIYDCAVLMPTGENQRTKLKETIIFALGIGRLSTVQLLLSYPSRDEKHKSIDSRIFFFRGRGSIFLSGFVPAGLSEV